MRHLRVGRFDLISFLFLPIQVEWLDDVKEVMEEPHAGAFDRMKEVLEAGMELSPHPSVEKALGELSGLLTQVTKSYISLLVDP